MAILKTVNLKSLGKKYQGKVRDFYILQDKRVLITTDRQSAFDVILGHIPHKGQVLNQLSAFWFDKTKKIIPNHMVSVPDPNVMIVKDTKPILVEMVVRGYMTGVTVTAIWPSYQRGERVIYGVRFKDGLKKNDKLKTPVITPTYHGDITGKGGHDTRLTKKEIVKNKIVPKKIYEQMEKASLALFKFGQKWCEKHGLILVDTKYEFGLYKNKLILIDEIHTPDSSRFWVKKTYKERLAKGFEPENFDKEFLRLWYVDRGYKGDGKPPPMPESLVKKCSKRYIDVYKKITEKPFRLTKNTDTEKRIRLNLQKAGY